MAFKDPFQLKQHWDSVMPRLPSLPVRALISEQHLNTCFCRFSKLADSAEALAARDVCTKNEVDFLKTKAAIISKLFLSSDIPPRLRVRCWAVHCSRPWQLGADIGRERTDRGWNSSKNALKLQNVLWSSGTILGLHGNWSVTKPTLALDL